VPWNPDKPFPSSAALGETDSGARNLPGFLCSKLRPGPVLVLGASEVALRAARRHDVVVLDWNRRRLSELSVCARERGLALDGVCRDPDRESLGVPLRSLANAICLDVLERSRDDVALLDRIRRSLEPEGRLVLRVRAGRWVREEQDRDSRPARPYDPASLRTSLDAAGFQVLEIRHWNLLGVPAAFLWDRCLRRPHRDDGRMPASERPRHWWDSVADQWFVAVENRVALPVGVSLVATATPLLAPAEVRRAEPEGARSTRPSREAYEPMATTR
jgi:hypothetical protein